MRLDEKNKKKAFKLKNMGTLREEEFDEIFRKGADKFIELNFDDSFNSEDFFPAEGEAVKENDKKTIAVSRLYGSAKPRMLIERKDVRKKFFSHSRIFGNKQKERDLKSSS